MLPPTALPPGINSIKGNTKEKAAVCNATSHGFHSWPPSTLSSIAEETWL